MAASTTIATEMMFRVPARSIMAPTTGRTEHTHREITITIDLEIITEELTSAITTIQEILPVEAPDLAAVTQTPEAIIIQEAIPVEPQDPAAPTQRLEVRAIAGEQLLHQAAITIQVVHAKT